MRWLIALVTAMALALVVAACQQAARDEATPSEATNASAQVIPTFSLPAPDPSARINLDRAAFGAPQTVGDVERQLRGALKARGYPDGRYYAVPGGFALVTEIERIRPSGEPYPVPARWSVAPTPLLEDFSFANLLDRLRHADPGHYRALVFLVTTTAVTSGGPQATISQVQKWVGEGGDFLPQDIARVALTPGHNIALLIYEFERSAVAAEPRQVSDISAEQHLRATRLLR